MSEGGVVMANPECIVTRLRLRARQFGVMPMRCCITNASCAIQSPRSQGRRGENERSGWVGFRQDCPSWKGAAIARTCEQLPASSRTCAVTISGHANPHRPRGPHHPRLNVYATHVTLTSKNCMCKPQSLQVWWKVVGTCIITFSAPRRSPTMPSTAVREQAQTEWTWPRMAPAGYSVVCRLTCVWAGEGGSGEDGSSLCTPHSHALSTLPVASPAHSA